MEKTTAETQLGQLKLQLLQLQQDKALWNSKLQLLLNSEPMVIPVANSPKIEFKSEPTSGVEQHPLLQSLEQQKATAAAQTQLEKSRKLPMLTLGYNNMSITGTGADNVLYDKSTRFHSAQIGLGIPLLGGSQSAKVKAAKVQEQMAAEAYEREKTTLIYKRCHFFHKYFNQFITSSCNIDTIFGRYFKPCRKSML